MKVTMDLYEGKNKTIICHDWGCSYTYLFDSKYPGYFKQIIALDVPAYVQLTTVYANIFVLVYQVYLIIAFLIGGFIGKFMTQKFAQFGKHNPPYFSQIDASRNYPYYYFWKSLLNTALRRKEPLLDRKYVPSVPVVSLYGKNKPFDFHGPKW